MVIRYGTLRIVIYELVNLIYKILLNEVFNLQNDKSITYNVVIDVLNNIQSNYDRIIKQNIEQLINKHFVVDDKDCYLTVDFPFVKVLYNKLDNQQLTNTDVHFLDTIKIELPTIHNFKDIIQPLHSIINNNPNVDKEFLNRLTTQEYLLIEEHIFNIMSKYVDYLNYQLLIMIMFKLSKMLVNNSNKASKVDDDNKVLGIVTIDKNIVLDEKNHSYIYKWVYGIFDVSTSERENTMKLHINYLSKKYNGSDVKIQYEYIPYIPLPTNKVLSVSDE